ncbi:Asp/Glu/hydantoin racemase [Kribbella hippodromi]|uniref:Asp/Glu/hydantoin racemase n=1 Tax=Kribbella hippodromi TaxID=434347 RepID=A0ABP4NH45_9ACTN
MSLKIGVLTPHAAPGPEVELPEMAPGLDVVLARISQGVDPTPWPPSAAADLRALTVPSTLQQAITPLREASVDAIAYASTTTAYAIGHVAEADLISRLRHGAGVPVVSSGLAAAQALKTFGVRRVALIHPPWFEDEMGELGAAYFRAQGIDAVTLTATPLPKNPAQVRPQHVIDWVTHQEVDAEAVFIAGNGFRAVGAIDELERRTGQLVLEANQVLLWSVLAATGSALPVEGYGRLFART